AEAAGKGAPVLLACTRDALAVTDPFQSSRRLGRCNALSKLPSSTTNAASATGIVCGGCSAPAFTWIFWSWEQIKRGQVSGTVPGRERTCIKICLASLLPFNNLREASGAPKIRDDLDGLPSWLDPGGLRLSPLRSRFFR